MRCPFCEADRDNLKVVDSRNCEGGRTIRRRRRCVKCGKRFTTYERIVENIRLTVIKKDGSRVPYERSKILLGLERACYKRPVREEDLQRLVDEVEDEIQRTHDNDVPSAAIGRIVTEKLRRLDQVAYVRFASVYRSFKTLDELVREARAVIDAQHYDLPGQGRLFVEASAAPEEAEAASPDEGGEEQADADLPPRAKKTATRAADED